MKFMKTNKHLEGEKKMNLGKPFDWDFLENGRLTTTWQTIAEFYQKLCWVHWQPSDNFSNIFI